MKDPIRRYLQALAAGAALAMGASACGGDDGAGSGDDGGTAAATGTQFLQLAPYGSTRAAMNSDDTQFELAITVERQGKNASGQHKAALEPWGEAALRSFNAEEGASYQLLPEGLYAIEPQEVTLEDGEAGKAAVIVRSMDGDDVDAVARLPYSSLISDSLYSGTDTPHPRLYGSFPRFIRDFALDRKVVSLEEAVWKMTGLPAQRYHLADRGLVEEGRRADLVLLDPSRIRDRATYAQATLPCEGIEKVYVAGRKVYECGRMVAHDCGRLLRREE